MRLPLASVAFLFLLSNLQPVRSQSGSEAIRLNQVGFYPNGPKMAVVVDGSAGPFQVVAAGTRQVVFRDTLGAPRTNPLSGKVTRTADFSALRSVGTFVVEVPGWGTSHPFAIKPAVHRALAQAALKGFYFQRASTSLPVRYAGVWHRPAGHPDTAVLVHPSAASALRPAGTRIAAPRGWYDAGDYNKYVVNSGITLATLFSLYEDFPEFSQNLEVDIPESANALPDVLDEALWNLRWLLAMQDPADGGVYHKLTNASFDGMVMPQAATKPRYVVQKSSTATLDFAAVTAQASRVFGKFENQVPGLADSCRRAAERAWTWARQNPDAPYRQAALNERFDPDVVTGGYEDRDPGDEWIWAAAELYVTTGDERYRTAVDLFPDEKMPLPSWAQVRLLGYYTLARAGKELPRVKPRLLAFADSLALGTEGQAFQTVMGKSARDFVWGSSAVAANQGIALLQAYRLSDDAAARRRYLALALANLDYLLGRNATGYAFVTGFGGKRVLHPHHRPSVADGLDAPVPGLLSGGPNAQAPRQDRCAGYPATTAADEVFVDADCSYASNEIAINWNAPLVYLAAALEAMQDDWNAPKR